MAATLEQRIDAESRSAALARQERDAALAASAATPAVDTLNAELRESQDRQLSLQRELLRLRDAKLALEAELQRWHESASAPAPAVAEPPLPQHPPVSSTAPLPLTALRGLGPALEKKLRGAGLTSVQDLAALSPEALAELDRSLKLSGRPQRDRWLEQARALVDAPSLPIP
jgi:predicted flap endonuclease-1-like 5' DNA nuclease